MGFRKDLRSALVTIANADTGAGGLVTLSGSTNPLWYFGNQKDEELPLATYFFVDDAEGTHAGKTSVFVQFTVWSNPESGATYIEDAEDMRDRIEAVMTQSNLESNGVDAAPLRPKRRDITPDDEGTIGLILEIEFFNGE